MSTAENPEAIADAFVAAWNAHDMTALAGLFHEDASFVNRYGDRKRGREAIHAQHDAIHRGIYARSRLAKIAVDVDTVADGVAVIHFLSELTVGDAMPHGPRVLDTLMLIVATTRDGRWGIRAAENVTVLNPATGEPILQR